jgi:anti-sigma factor RsiW
MFSCRELVDSLMACLDGTLPRERRSEIEAHLATYSSCVAYMNSYRRSIKLSKESAKPPEDSPAAQMPEQLIRAILAARKKSK